MTPVGVGTISGAGIGLRPVHTHELISETPEVGWLEILADNYLASNTTAERELKRIVELYPVTLHSVNMSIGSTDLLNRQYLKRLRELATMAGAAWVSDHLCWTSVHGVNFHDLLPLPYTEETVTHVTKRIKAIQDVLERPLVIENVSTYLNFSHSTMTEWEFVAAVASEAQCELLVDLNNIYVNSQNHGYDPLVYIQHLPKGRIKYFHLGGHEDRGDHLLDSHSRPVADPVWNLFQSAVETLGPLPTLIEWDNDIPPLATLLAESALAQAILDDFTKGRFDGQPVAP